MERLLSYSEISRVMTCQAAHDFQYGDQLAGSSLRSKTISPLLSAGKAWGAAVAALHIALGVDPGNAGSAARMAMDASLEDDVERQREFGTFNQEYHDELRTQLLKMLIHYIGINDEAPWVLDVPDEPGEKELIVPIPSRNGGRASSRYKLLSYLDGVRQIEGRPWLVEFKLRKTLTSAEFVALNRQIRIYAWAWWQDTGIKPAGVEVHERLNAAPKMARMLQSGKPSHAKDQMCTAEAYQMVCQEHGEPMKAETFDALTNRKWQQTIPIIFRDGELEEAGRELVSAAKLIQQLDSGALFPVRNARPQNCRGCFFKEICPAPDPELIDALYERVPAKRNRKETHEPA